MRTRKPDRNRETLALEAARIIVEEGVNDYQKAKLKACERLRALGSLPSNSEIETAVQSFIRTFLPEHERLLWWQRTTALTVMRWLEPFSPYLTGPVLEGTACAGTPISIHVSCDCLEEVLSHLQQCVEDIRIEDRRFRQNRHATRLPGLGFSCMGHEVEVTVFSLRQRHQPLKSKTRNHGMQRMNVKALVKLLDEARHEAIPAWRNLSTR